MMGEISPKEELLQLLDSIAEQQKKISICHDYYQSLEKEIEKKKTETSNPEDYESFAQEMAHLSKEYEEKSDFFYEDLNQDLIKGYELAEKIGDKVAHDFTVLWKYMTNIVREEVELHQVLSYIEAIRKDFLL